MEDRFAGMLVHFQVIQVIGQNVLILTIEYITIGKPGGPFGIAIVPGYFLQSTFLCQPFNL